MKNLILATILFSTSFAFAGNNAAIRLSAGSKVEASELAELVRDDSCFRNIFAGIKSEENRIQNSSNLNYLSSQTGPAEIHFNYVHKANDDIELKITLRLHSPDGESYTKQVMIPVGKKHVPDLPTCEKSAKLGFEGVISFALRDSNDPDSELGSKVRDKSRVANQAPNVTGSQN